MGMFGATLYVPLFIQGILGDSATNSGLIMTPMMLAFIGSTIVGGQLLSRTGRYRRQAIAGIGLATVGMLLLSQMDVGASSGTLIRNMFVLGLGLGIGMTLFTIVVQNAFSSSRLGEVSSAMQFFRSIGGTIGIAIFGSIMTNRYRDVFDNTLAPDVRAALTPEQVTDLRNPQVLLSDDTTREIRATFDALGTNGQALYDQFMVAVRESLTTAITNLFFFGAIAMFIGFVVVCFLPEIPLRRTRRGEPDTPAAAATQPGTDTDTGTGTSPIAPRTDSPAPTTAD
jgi:MFS family permease